MRNAEFEDPRLVPVYDALCPWSRDDDFFVSVVERTPRARVLDLGCGTGRLALALAARGHSVTGVDPARGSLDAARAKRGADGVTWLEGTAAVVPPGRFDVALMTSHVAQFLVDDRSWQASLRDLRRAMSPGGTLAFDSRDPDARAWERWNANESRRRVTVADRGWVEVWNEVDSVEGDTVTFTLHYEFSDGQELRSTSTLRFRPEHALRSSLEAAGFAVEEIYGGWLREPVGEGDGELLVLARAAT